MFMDNTRVTRLAWQVAGAVNLHHKTAEGHSAFPDGFYIYVPQYFSSEIDSNTTSPQHKAALDLQAVFLRRDIHWGKKGDIFSRINRTVNKSINYKKHSSKQANLSC